MSSSSREPNLVILKGIRPLLSWDSEFLINEDKVRYRTCSSIHRNTSSYHMSISEPEIRELETFIPVSPTVFIYNKDSVVENSYASIEDIPAIKNDECLWIDVIGVQNEVLLSSISRRFKIHSLVIADIATNDQRTKLDVFEDALFLIIKLINSNRDTQQISIEQISFYMKENILITFQEKSSDIFDSIKNKIRLDKGRTRKSKIDYLFYSLVDKVVDQYMDVLDGVGRKIEAIERNLMEKLSRDTLASIYELKREMLFYRGSIVPLKEIIIKLQKEEETQIIQEGTIIYLKDLYDHVVQVNDTIDVYREMLASFISFFMMLNSNGMNQVVKTLTIISTVFIPLTFIVGVYGMNFDNMPELHWEYGYFMVLFGMAVLTLIMFCVFKRKKWF
ncbi:unnamed protein product [Adineta steineri]|uniref:Magnesium transport protein CorA n=1 Tax=Adineta steineri TaxID=433720 RepID=A0A813MMZ9_9BILA|nr:unnamed protein product [Adineta steineri]CAF0835526.1 unnamed protein product [Adineta steineri]